MLAVFSQVFSPSMVPARGNVARELFTFGLISTAVNVIASWFTLRGRRVLVDRLRTANGLVACGLLVSLAPLAVERAVYPGPFHHLPGPTMMVLIPATYIASACFALATAAILIIELVVFFARAVDPRARHWRRPQTRRETRRRLPSTGQYASVSPSPAAGVRGGLAGRHRGSGFDASDEAPRPKPGAPGSHPPGDPADDET
jgi:hypothetical protein